MDNTYISVIEALIFSSDDSLSADEIIRAVKSIDGDDTELTKSDVDSMVDLLNQKYIDNENAFRILRVANGYLYATLEALCKVCWVSFFRKSKKTIEPGCT